MPKRYWLHCAAIGGILVACAPTSYAQDNRGDAAKTPQVEQAQPQPNPPLPITISGPVRVEREKEVEPDWNNLKCDQAKSHDEADLCEQRRMAKAAEQTVRLNLIQIAVAVVGFGLVLWNLFYVRKATVAAVEAAKAGSTQAQAAMESVYANRAWMTMKGFDSEISTGNFEGKLNHNVLVISLRWANAGNTPALKTNILFKKEIVPFNGPAPHFDIVATDDVALSAPIGPGQEVSSRMVYFSDGQHADFVARKSTIYLYCRVTYEDIYHPGSERLSEVCLKVVYHGFTKGEDGRRSTIIAMTAVGPQNTGN